MDIRRALTFPFEDRDWLRKFAIGSLLSWIPFFALGYQVNVVRNLIHGDRTPIPDNNQLGMIASDGVMATVAAFVYAIPIMPLLCVLSIVSGVMGQSDLGQYLAFCLVCCVSGFIFIYGAIAMALYWVGMIRFTATGNFSSFLQFGKLWRDVNEHMTIIFVLLLYTLGLAIAVSVIGSVSIITCIGVLVVNFYYHIVSGHLIGQAANMMAGD